MSAPAYPLHWPPHIERSTKREVGRFKTSLSAALNNVRDSLRRFSMDSGKKIDGLVISSNYSLTDPKPSDPGVAAYFTWDGMPICIPLDRYTTIEANLQAVHHVLEARRTELRHGTLALVRATFQGFRALPAPSQRTCWDVLGIEVEGGLVVNAELIEKHYRAAAKKRHPDHGGTDSAMAELNEARRQALKMTAAT